jgi:hypothetical protein
MIAQNPSTCFTLRARKSGMRTQNVDEDVGRYVDYAWFWRSAAGILAGEDGT